MLVFAYLSGSAPNFDTASRPTVCRNCGAIVGAGEANCGVCGAPTTPQVATSQRPIVHDREALRFARAVLNRPYKFTITLLVANLFVFMLMWESSGMSTHVLWEAFPHSVLIAYGAKLNAYIAPPHNEWWRFVTPMFIHVNLLHLMVNMYSLWMIGPFVEKLYGSAKFVVIWVLTGIAGVVASYLTVRPNLATSGLSRFIFKALDEPSAGASGALFGLVGVLFVFGIKYRHELPEGFKRAFGTGLLPVILINLFIGFLGRGFIDNAAHLGGLLCGAALAVVVSYRRPGESHGSTIVWRVMQVAALTLVGVSFLKVAQHFPTYRAQAPVLTQRDQFLNYLQVMNQAHETISFVLSDNDKSGVESTIKQLETVVGPDPKAEELKIRLIELFGRVPKQPVSTPSPEQGRPTAGLDKKLIADFATWNKDYNAWLKSAIATHSINQ